MTDNQQQTPLLQAVGISKIYSQGALAVGLHRFSASFYRGEFVAITGSSGSGKSTLLNLLSGLDNYDEGELYFDGDPTSHFDEEDRAAYRKDNVAFIFQDYYLLDSYTVFQNIELALIYAIPDPKARAKRVNELIAAVGLQSHAKQRCSHLSGGQKQRVSIARALAKDAPILFADEPCGNLDSAMTADVMQLLHDLCKDKLVLIVTHSFDEVEPYATRKIRLADGECVEDQVFEQVSLPKQEVTRNAITKKQELAGLVRVAANNIKATPKRSFFGIIGLTILTSIFIWGMLLVIYNVMPESFSGAYYKYDLQVTKAELDVDLTEQDLESMRSIKGVDGVYRYSYAFNCAVYYSVTTGDVSGHIRPICNFEGALYEGRLPTKENEVLISIPGSRRNFRRSMVGKELEVEIYNYETFRSSYAKVTVVGVTVDDEGYVYTIDSFFVDTAGEDKSTAIVTLSQSANMNSVRDQLRKKGYVAMHLYGDNPDQGFGNTVKWMFAILLGVTVLICFRFTAGSFRSLESVKRRDYNIMRTVGLPNRFIQKIYYVEMVLQAIIAWVLGTILSIIIWLIYGFSLTPSLGYGFKMMGTLGSDLSWIIPLSLVVNLIVTLHTASRFNRYFYRQTVKNALKGGNND